MDLIRSYEKHRLNSVAGEITGENYFKINNTSLEPEVTAKMIKEYFNL